MKNFFILTIITLPIACSGDTNKLPIIDIDPYSKPINRSLSEIASQLEVVKLETDVDALLGNFSFLVHLDDRNIIFKSNKSVLIFGRDGKYQSKIHALGKGPEEYNTIVSVLVNPLVSEIWVVDYISIKVYDYKANFLRKIDMPYLIAGILRLPNGTLLLPKQQIYSEENRQSLSILDSSLVEVKSVDSRLLITTNEKQNLFYTGNPFVSGEGVYFREPFVDTLYKVSESELVPAWIFDTKGKGFQVEDGINSSNWHDAMKRGKIPLFSLRGTEKHFFISFNYLEGKCLQVYDKTKSENFFFRRYTSQSIKQGIDNDLSELFDSFWPNYSNGERVIAQYIFPENMSNDQLSILNMGQEDNPILLIVTLGS